MAKSKGRSKSRGGIGTSVHKGSGISVKKSTGSKIGPIGVRKNVSTRTRPPADPKNDGFMGAGIYPKPAKKRPRQLPTK